MVTGHQPKAAGAPGGSEDVSRVTPEILAEAAAWIARLHGPNRSIRMERECLAWQARSDANRLAFERCTDTWQDVALITLSTYANAATSQSHVSAFTKELGRRPFLLASAMAVLVTAAMVVAQPWSNVERYITGLGEQRMVMLPDGSRMSLNTSTRVRVEFSSSWRNVGVDKGEALFEVAKDAGRPFVVRASGSEVVALGTVFLVRLGVDFPEAADSLAVTLIEGSVIVRATEEVARGLAPTQPISMAAGDRVRLAEAVGALSQVTTRADRPRVDQLVAWKRSEAVFDDVALAVAVSEMNRYSRSPLILTGPNRWRDLHVSGLFRTGDSVGFAKAVAAVHGLTLREYPDRLELSPH